MPTPVTAARQCLAQEAAAALDEAVAVARRRGHAQTTSLHMVSSLLSLPRASCLREACTRTTRSGAYSARVQFKALELSLSVSLDRFPSSPANRVEEPPVSNSLMAAIKRSQANQRRQPECFTFYQQQQQQQCCSAPVVKVELQNLVFAILDDPLVSRVFGEAGFRSCDIKMAAVRPGNGAFHQPHLFGGYSLRYRSIELRRKGYGFPFMGCFPGDENSRRIGEVMVRSKKRNPLLLGVSAGEALRAFLETLQRKGEGVLPVGLNGVSVVCVKDEVLRLLNGDCDGESLRLRFEEVERLLGNGEGSGVVVSLGDDLKALAGDGVGIDGLRYLVGRLGSLLEDHGGNLWLIGAAASYEVYFQILNKFPTIQEELDLEILPITTLSVGGSYRRSSLMESFVPLGGFFSMPSDTKDSFSNAHQYVARCHLCNEKYNQEVTQLSSAGRCASVAEHYQSSLTSLSQPNTWSGSTAMKAKDDSLPLSAKIAGLQKKWDSVCQHHHYNQAFLKGYAYRVGSQSPHVVRLQVSQERKENTGNDNSFHSNASITEQGNQNLISTLATDSRQISSLNEARCLNMLSKTNSLRISSKSGQNFSEFLDEKGAIKSQHLDSSSASDGSASPNSVASVTTDLGLGIASSSISREPQKPVDESHGTLIQDLSGSLSPNAGAIKSSISNCPSQFSCMHFDKKESDMLYKHLIQRVGQHQEEAISAVVQAINQCQTKTTGFRGMSRGDIWISLQGPDRLSKKKLGLALAEIIYRSTENFICVDLSFEDEMVHLDAELNPQVINKYDLTMRRTVVDYLVEKLSKNPGVVFLENIDRSDPLVQYSLSQARKTGRIMDLHGREVNISNSVFLAITKFLESDESLSEPTKYSEEDILKVKGSLIQIGTGFDLNDVPRNENLRLADATKEGHSDLAPTNKRKMTDRCKSTDQCGSWDMTKRAHKASNSCLDLNLPAQESEMCNDHSSDSDSSCENPKSWLEDFDRQVDLVVVFKPFDFDTLAEKLFNDMNECMHEIVGRKCTLEIESQVMQQLLAAAYLLDKKRVEDWIQCVLMQGFMEAMGKFSHNAHFIIKLITCEDSVAEEHSEGLLPGRIMVN